jgi:pyridoxal phosphate enzyme (YggS family)
MNYLEKFKDIKKEIYNTQKKAKLILVTKNQTFEKILDILNLGHLDFGENKIQEAKIKWADYLKINNTINLHLIGKLQSNKVKDAFDLFKFIHTLDNEKLAKKFSELEKHSDKKIKYFIQVNIGNESHKNGINISLLSDFVYFCQKDLRLNILGLMCIPPVNHSPKSYFLKLKELNENNNLRDLSMGMSGDFQVAIQLGATYVRVGSAIFGGRSI